MHCDKSKPSAAQYCQQREDFCDTPLQDALEIKVTLLVITDACTKDLEDHPGKTGAVHEPDSYFYIRLQSSG